MATERPRVDEIDRESALLLIALDSELVLEPSEAPGRLQTSIGTQTFQIGAEALDDLELRGWVEIDEAGVRLTEKGRYWAGRATRAVFKCDRVKVGPRGARHMPRSMLPAKWAAVRR